MNNLSTAAGTDISNLIGALELGDRVTNYGDGVLESAGMNVDPYSKGLVCPTLQRCIGDGAG